MDNKIKDPLLDFIVLHITELLKLSDEFLQDKYNPKVVAANKAIRTYKTTIPATMYFWYAHSLDKAEQTIKNSDPDEITVPYIVGPVDAAANAHIHINNKLIEVRKMIERNQTIQTFLNFNKFIDYNKQNYNKEEPIWMAFLTLTRKLIKKKIVLTLLEKHQYQFLEAPNWRGTHAFLSLTNKKIDESKNNLRLYLNQLYKIDQVVN